MSCSKSAFRCVFLANLVQWNLDLRKPDLRKNLDLRKIVGATNFMWPNVQFKKDFFPKSGLNRDFLDILEQFCLILNHQIIRIMNVWCYQTTMHEWIT